VCLGIHFCGVIDAQSEAYWINKIAELTRQNEELRCAKEIQEVQRQCDEYDRRKKERDEMECKAVQNQGAKLVHAAEERGLAYLERRLEACEKCLEVIAECMCALEAMQPIRSCRRKSEQDATGECGMATR
jgi:hypothetical protein